MLNNKNRILIWLDDNQRQLELFFTLLLGVYLFIWSIQKGFNYGPDEHTRYNLPLFLYKYGHFPMGDAPEIRDSIWGFSYAFMPTWLEPIIACIFMHIGTFFFGKSHTVMLISARFVSVLAMSLAAYFLLRALDKIVSRPAKWIAVLVIVSIPQYAFIGSYINQDSVNLCGATIILCAWTSGLTDGWNMKNSILLSIGISVVTLSYYFGYGWILGSIILFFLSFFLQLGNNNDYNKMRKLALLITLLVFIITMPFLLRNIIVYDGDLLGRAHMQAAQLKYGQDWIQKQNRPTLQMQGYSFFFLFEIREWWRNTFITFVGSFGYMQYTVPEWIWKFYGLIFFGGGIAAFGEFIRCSLKNEKKRWVFYLFIILELILPVVLSMWYSYTSDYQPQGRYIFALIPALAVILAKGYDFCKKQPWARDLIFVFIILCVSMKAFYGTYLFS